MLGYIQCNSISCKIFDNNVPEMLNDIARVKIDNALSITDIGAPGYSGSFRSLSKTFSKSKSFKSSIESSKSSINSSALSVSSSSPFSVSVDDKSFSELFSELV